METCRIVDCCRPIRTGGMCSKHYQSLRVYGDPLKAKTRRANGSGHVRSDGRIGRKNCGVHLLEHVHVAEKAIGKPLPLGAEVHHVDENPANNEPSNLVICPDHAYHMLIHQRMKAMDACGDPNWRKCKFCKSYAPLESLKFNKTSNSGSFFHSECRNRYQNSRYALKHAANHHHH